MSIAVPSHIAHLLEKMTSSDKDFRFMATNDLMSELQKDSIKLDDDLEGKVVRMLLKVLEDTNLKVGDLAVKCLGQLVAKVKETQVETIVDTLCTNMTGDKEQLRDISSIGLKTVITELPLTSQLLASVICKKIIGKLSVAISKQEEVTVQLEALDILGDILSKFGNILQQYHTMLLDELLPQLNSGRQAVRKRTVVALGHLAASCGVANYHKLVGILIEEMRKGLQAGNATTYIQCSVIVCKNAGQRFSEYLNQIVGMLMTASDRHEDDELNENTLQAFEIFVTRCPQEMGALGHLNEILQMCVKLITHNPNYLYNDVIDYEEEQEEDEYSDDDDDMSWRVRRAAAKCIEAVIVSRPDILTYLYQKVSPVLIGRFREKEEIVRCEVFSAYRALLTVTRPVVQALNEYQITGIAAGGESDEPTAVQLLEGQIVQLVEVVQKQLEEKNIKSRQLALQLLSELVGVLPGCLTLHLSNMMNGILVCLSDRSSTSNVRQTLSLLYCIMNSHPVKVIQPHVETLLPALLTCAGDNFYKVISEALLSLQALIKAVRSSEIGTREHPNSAAIAQKIYPVVLHSLKATDIDQEVTETAITTMAILLTHLGLYIQSEWLLCIPIFIERLKNEITTLTTVKALNLMASSKLMNLNFKTVLAEAIPVLSSFLRKNQRALKLATLNLLYTLFKRYKIELALLEGVINELPLLLSESDLHCTRLVLQLMTSLAAYKRKALEFACLKCMTSIKILVRSPLMQGAALICMMDFLRALVKAEIRAFTSTHLLAIFLEQEKAYSTSKIDASSSTHQKQNFYSLAKCISVICVGRGKSRNPKKALKVASSFLTELEKIETVSDVRIIIALLSIGEIGRHVDLSMLQNLRDSILQLFSHPSEEVRTAASYSLGSVAIGNLFAFLPALLKEMESQPGKQYLLLHALKEIISGQQNVNISLHAENIWVALIAHAECPEERTRNLVAECLGRLTLANPDEFIPRLKSALESQSNLLRATVVTAVKFTIVVQPHPIDVILMETMGDFLTSLADPDLNVRRVALVAFTAAAHNKPALIRNLLPQLLPQLYMETQIRKELIRVIEMGRYRRTIDDGLDLRRAAFECMDTLLDSCLDRLDIREFLTHVENGLRDHYDIKMLTYLMVARLATLCPSQVIQRLDRLIEPLKNTVLGEENPEEGEENPEEGEENPEEGEENPQQEDPDIPNIPPPRTWTLERALRAALRAVSALSAIPDANENLTLLEFVDQIRNSAELQALYDSVQSDTTTGIGSNEAPLQVE